ncbi:retrotransposon hot spot (RHS) protein, partial [Trypanosoma theileri]
KPDMYIQDKEMIRFITALPAYERIRENMGILREKVRVLNEVANNLEKAGVYSLQQWDEFTDKESILLMARGILNAALNIAKEKGFVSQDATSVVMEGVYESVYNATWHYVQGVGGRGFGMQVKEGHPPQLWTDDEVMKGSAEDDNDYEKPEDGRLELMVFTSEKGWSYTEFSMNKSCDIYVNKEVMRVWYKILENLDKYFGNNVDAIKELTPYVLIGTPGIGKSFAAGSFLLYQLLHYNAKKLPVVACFIRGGAYLFEKKNDGGKVTWYEGEEKAVSVVGNFFKRGEENKEKRGYIIYDVDEKSRGPPTRLPPSGWGMIVISSPNEEQYKGWRKQKGAYRIVMNCPTVREIKAICAWEKRNQSKELKNHWKEIKERINNIGPLPRHIFDDGMYRDRCNEVKDTLDLINESNITEYKNILRGIGEWKDKSPSHKLVKIYRVVINCRDVPRNKPITVALGDQIVARVIVFLKSPVLNMVFTDKGVIIAEGFQRYGVNAFTDKNFVTALSEVLQIIQPPKGRVSQQSVLQRRDLITFASDGYLSFPTSIKDEKRRIEYNMLYHPSISNFPLVDAFYFVKSPEGTVTLIGIQATTATIHETTVTAVIEFNKYLKNCFSDWTDVSKEVSWEIIYIQPYGTDERRQIKKWQGCTLNESGNYNLEEREVTAKIWNEKVNQYQVDMSPTMIVWLIEALMAMY